MTQLPDGWAYVRLPDVIDFQEGPGVMARDFRPHGIPLIRLAGLSAGGSVLNGSNFLDEETVRRRWSHFAVREGDTLLSTSASLGRVARVGPEAVGAIPYTGIIRMRPADDRVDPDFIGCMLESKHFQAQAEAMGAGSVMRHFGPSHLRSMTVPLPPLSEQRAIAGVLGALDDKIELNRRMNETLEQIAITRFRSLMRKSWPSSTLGESFRVSMGQSPPGSSYNGIGEGVVFFQGRAEFGPRYPTPRLYCTAPTRFAKAGDALVSVRAPVGDVNMAEVDLCIGRGLAAVRHRTGSRSFSYYAMKSLSTTFDVFDGEGTVFGSINKARFLSLPWPQVPDAEILRFEEQAAPFDSLIEVNHRQSRTLVDLRDALLPKLISGELRVRDAEAAAERAK